MINCYNRPMNKRKILFTSLFAITGLIFAQTAHAEGKEQAALSTRSTTLCLPGVYQSTPNDCLPLGPSEYLTRMANVGITFPSQPMATQSPDSSLKELPFFYAKVRDEQRRVFSSLDAAIAGEPVHSNINPGLSFVTYIDRTVFNDRRYYMIEPGIWMRSGDLTLVNELPSFVGLDVLGTPERKFGWILYSQESKHTPFVQADDFTGNYFSRYDVVQVYDSVMMDGFEWILIGPDEWVQARHVGLVYPNSLPPTGVENGRWVEVNLFEQTISVYQDNRLIYATLVSSGVPGWWTRPGLFQVMEKLDSTKMSGSFEADRSDYYYLQDVPWTLYFDESRAFHGTYWHNKFGSENSHGCANLSPGDSRWLFDWANVGDWVYVWDPSGETPVDPSLYGPGGA